MLRFDTICINQDFKSAIKDRNWGHWKLPRNNLFVMYLDWLLITVRGLSIAERLLASCYALISSLAQHLFKKIISGIRLQSRNARVFQLTMDGWCGWQSTCRIFTLNWNTDQKKKKTKIENYPAMYWHYFFFSIYYKASILSFSHLCSVYIHDPFICGRKIPFWVRTSHSAVTLHHKWGVASLLAQQEREIVRDSEVTDTITWGTRAGLWGTSTPSEKHLYIQYRPFVEL